MILINLLHLVAHCLIAMAEAQPSSATSSAADPAPADTAQATSSPVPEVKQLEYKLPPPERLYTFIVYTYPGTPTVLTEEEIAALNRLRTNFNVLRKQYLVLKDANEKVLDEKKEVEKKLEAQLMVNEQLRKERESVERKHLELIAKLRTYGQSVAKELETNKRQLAFAQQQLATTKGELDTTKSQHALAQQQLEMIKLPGAIHQELANTKRELETTQLDLSDTTLRLCRANLEHQFKMGEASKAIDLLKKQIATLLEENAKLEANESQRKHRRS